MIRSASRPLLIAGGALALVSGLAAPAEAQPAQVPNFQSGPGGWTHPFGGGLPAEEGSGLPPRQGPSPSLLQPAVWLRIRDPYKTQPKRCGQGLMSEDQAHSLARDSSF